jgi:hypothetical protein
VESDLYCRRLGCRRRRRRRPTLGAQASIFGTLAGDGHQTGRRTPSLPFLLCETEHPSLSYLHSDLI